MHANSACTSIGMTHINEFTHDRRLHDTTTSPSPCTHKRSQSAGILSSKCAICATRLWIVPQSQCKTSDDTRRNIRAVEACSQASRNMSAVQRVLSERCSALHL
eukprot:5126752-Pleurochrysis_carterae.AAC.1